MGGLPYLTLPYLTSSCSITHKASTSLYHPAILKCVPGFSYEIFVTHRPTPNLEGQVMQFPCPFMRNLPDMVNAQKPPHHFSWGKQAYFIAVAL